MSSATPNRKWEVKHAGLDGTCDCLNLISTSLCYSLNGRPGERHVCHTENTAENTSSPCVLMMRFLSPNLYGRNHTSAVLSREDVVEITWPEFECVSVCECSHCGSCKCTSNWIEIIKSTKAICSLCECSCRAICVGTGVSFSHSGDIF